MNKQHGFGGLEIGILIVFAAILISMVTYHYITVAGYKTEIKTLGKTIDGKQKAIDQLAKEKAEEKAKVAACLVANSGFNDVVKSQNAALAAVKKERDDANERWRQATAKGKRDSLEYEARIAGILGAGPLKGETWFESWDRVLGDYFKGRKGETK